MKRILSIILAISALVTSLTVLTACDNSENDVPENMQLVRGGEDVGYYFYGPKGWAIANQGEISATYVSTVNYSSLIFSPLTEPEERGEGFSYAEYFKSVFESDSDKYLRSPFSDFKLIESPKEKEDGSGLVGCTFGNANEAYKYIFSFTHEDRSYTAMQIFSVYKDRVYLFQYMASNAKFMNDESYYTYYLEDYVQPVIKNFKFVEKSGSVSKENYPTDKDGYMLVSDKRLTGFDMYVPSSYSVDLTTGIVCVSKENGVSITASAMINTTTYPHENYLDRKEKLEKLSDDGRIEEIAANNSFSPDNAPMASWYEYKYVLDGVEYHVYQVYVVDGQISRDFYVFTFTAPESVYYEEIDEGKTIFEKMVF